MIRPEKSIINIFYCIIKTFFIKNTYFFNVVILFKTVFYLKLNLILKIDQKLKSNLEILEEITEKPLTTLLTVLRCQIEYYLNKEH